MASRICHNNNYSHQSAAAAAAAAAEANKINPTTVRAAHFRYQQYFPGKKRNTDLIFINDPALRRLIPTIITFTLFSDLVDSKMFEVGGTDQRFAEGCFTDARCSGDDDVWFGSGHVVLSESH